MNRTSEHNAYGATGSAEQAGKIIVFGVLKQQGNVFSEIIPDWAKATLQAVIRGRLDLARLFIPMAGAATMAWSISALTNTSASTMM